MGLGLATRLGALPLLLAPLRLAHVAARALQLDAHLLGEMWGDVGRCGEMWGDARRCGEMQGDGGEMEGDEGRCAEMRGDVGRCRGDGGEI